MPESQNDYSQASGSSLNAGLNTWTSMTGNSPLVQGLALGLPAYALAKWIGGRGEWEFAQRMAANISDPVEREQYLRDAYNGKASTRFARIAGAMAGLSPLLFSGANIATSLKSDDIPGNLLKSLLSYKKPDTWSLAADKPPVGGKSDAPDGGLESTNCEMDKLADYYTIPQPGDRIRYPGPGERSSDTDLTMGRTFVMPTIRPLSLMGERDIPQRNSMELLGTQAPLLGDRNTYMLGSGLANASPGGSGLISTSDIFHGLVGAGVGAAAGWGLSHIMGTIFSQPPEVKNKMARYGAIGGAILNSGLLPKAAGYLSR